jgi:hypothetical protein
MKNTLQRSIVTILFLAALTPVRALAAASVYADEPPGGSVVAASELVPDANPPGMKGIETNIALSEKASVRIDKSGVHIGGAHPVDINVPSIANHHKDRGGIDVVGIVGVVFGCTIPIAIVAIIFYSRHRRLKMHHETIRAMVEKGLPIPPELVAAVRSQTVIVDNWAGPEGVVSARRDFRAGLILVGVGAGLLMVAGKVGWILVFIGAARLVFWLVEGRKPKA